MYIIVHIYSVVSKNLSRKETVKKGQIHDIPYYFGQTAKKRDQCSMRGDYDGTYKSLS